MPHCNCCGGAITAGSDDSHHVHCSLCKGMTYCSEQCAMSDWAIHSQECPNVVQVRDARDIMFRPYHFQDVPEAREILLNEPATDEIFQSYQLRHVDGNDRVLTKQIDSELINGRAIGFNSVTAGNDNVGRGARSSSQLRGSYNISIDVDGTDSNAILIEGTLPQDMIYSGNNDKGRRLLQRESSSYVFWPSPAQVADAKITIPQDSRYMRVTITPNITTLPNVPVTISGQYRFARNSKHRVLGPLFKAQLQAAQDRGFSSPLRGLRMLYGQDAEGNRVIMTFETNAAQKRALLVDMKMIVPTLNFKQAGDPKYYGSYYYRPDLKPGDVASYKNGTNVIRLYSNVDGEQRRDSPFECDAANLDDMTALSMALEHRMAQDQNTINEMIHENDDPRNTDIIEAKKHLAQMQSQFAVVSKHRLQLETALNEGVDELEIPMKVHVTVNNALDSLQTEPIEASMLSGFIKRKAAKNDYDAIYARLNKVVSELSEKYKDALENKRTAELSMDGAENGRERASIQAKVARYRAQAGLIKRRLQRLRTDLEKRTPYRKFLKYAENNIKIRDDEKKIVKLVQDIDNALKL